MSIKLCCYPELKSFPHVLWQNQNIRTFLSTVKKSKSSHDGCNTICLRRPPVQCECQLILHSGLTSVGNQAEYFSVFITHTVAMKKRSHLLGKCVLRGLGRGKSFDQYRHRDLLSSVQPLLCASQHLERLGWFAHTEHRL